MKVLGFNFTKISAEKKNHSKNYNVTPNIDFSDIKPDNVEMLKESHILKVYFKHNLLYKSPEDKKNDFSGEISFEGIIILSLTEDQSKEILKDWKKKNINDKFKLPITNLILRRCTPKALQLQDEINLPTHIPMPIIDKRN